MLALYLSIPCGYFPLLEKCQILSMYFHSLFNYKLQKLDQARANDILNNVLQLEEFGSIKVSIKFSIKF